MLSGALNTSFVFARPSKKVGPTCANVCTMFYMKAGGRWRDEMSREARPILERQNVFPIDGHDDDMMMTRLQKADK